MIGQISRGGMARLSLAVMMGVDGFQRVVALKQVLPNLADSNEFVQMFLNEARLAARLDHPNIVKIIELGSIADQYFCSMEFLPGENVGSIVRQCLDRQRDIPLEVTAAVGQ